jgi:hypothetical protein
MAVSSVKSIAAGLAVNSSLTSLKFASNNGGKPAALAFAAALRDNAALQHLNLSFNKLCPSGGEALAAALVAAGGNGSSSSDHKHHQLQRLVIQRKEIGGAGLRALIAALRRLTGYNGPLTLKVLHNPRLTAELDGGTSPAAAAAAAAGALCVLHLSELPVYFVTHEDQDVLLSESWLSQLVGKQQQEEKEPRLTAAVRAAGGDSPAAPGEVVIDIPDAAPVTARDQICADTMQCTGIGSNSSSSSSSSSSTKPVPQLTAALAAAPAAAAAAAAAPAAAGSSPEGKVTAAIPRNDSSSSTGSSNGGRDGLTPFGSLAADGLLPITVQAAAVAATGIGSSSSSSGNARCPVLVLLSQNDPCDTVAAALRHITDLAAVQVGSLHLGTKVRYMCCNSHALLVVFEVTILNA